MNPSKALALATLIFLSSNLRGAITMEFDWHTSLATGAPEYGGAVAVDGENNVFWAGVQPGGGGSPSVVVRKFTPAGSLMWSRQLRAHGSNGDAWVTRMSADAAGNIAIFQAGVAGESGQGTRNYLWHGGIARLTGAGVLSFDGLGIQAIRYGYSYTHFSAAAGIDSAGHPVFTFPYSSFTWNNQTYEAPDIDAAVIKVTPSGTLTWMRRITGPGVNTATALAVDFQGNIYVVGYTAGATTFEGTTLPATGERDAFIAKYNAEGVFQWVRGPTCGGWDISWGIAVGADGAVWFSGYFMGTLTFGTTTITTPWAHPYLARISPSGNPLSLARVEDVPQRLAPSGNNNILAVGHSYRTSAFGLPAAYVGGDDVCVAELTSDGRALWAKAFGSPQNDHPEGVAALSTGEVYVTATVNSGVRLGEVSIPGGSAQDLLLAKLVPRSVPDEPVVSRQPVAAVGFFGGEAVFRVEATSPFGISYQWFFNGVAIAGQTSATLTIASVRPESAGNYYVEVRNQYGTTRSESVRLVVAGEAPVAVTTLAGTGVAGYVDSAPGAVVRFNGPDSLAIQNDGVALIPDAANHVIRVLEPNGTVGTLAGRGPASPGFLDGAASAALFRLPIGLAVAPSWDILVADAQNHAVRRISAFGARAVTTVAGTGQAGFQDGPGATAQFRFPNDLVADGAGNLFVTEFEGHRVRWILPDGTVRTLAGTGVAGHQDGSGSQAQFNGPAGIARDTAGNLYVTDWNNHAIRKLTPGGGGAMVTTIAGSVGQSGFVDGPALTQARLFSPNGITVDASGNIFFTEFGNSSVRRIDPRGDVLTLVGTAGAGFANGGRTEAKMRQPGGIAAHPDGSLIVADTSNHAIRRVVWQADATPTEALVLIELNPSITIFGEAGRTYRIEATENLVTAEWVVLGEVTLISPVETWFDTQPVTRRQRYYRAVLRP